MQLHFNKQFNSIFVWDFTRITNLHIIITHFRKSFSESVFLCILISLLSVLCITTHGSFIVLVCWNDWVGTVPRSVHLQAHCLYCVSAQVDFLWCASDYSLFFVLRVQNYEIQSSDLNTTVKLLQFVVSPWLLPRIGCFRNCVLHFFTASL